MNWHETLNEVLWAMINTKSTATRVTPYQLVYEQDVVPPLENNVASLRVAKQHLLHITKYQQVMLMELDIVDDDRLAALSNIELSKIKVARAYKKKM